MVAPIKKLSIPCLGLSAAVMAVQLAPFIKRLFQIESLSTYFGTDSTIVMQWIDNIGKSMPPFVANRVSIIREMSEHAQWNHIAGADNPADLLTRGIITANLNKSSR